MKQHMKGFCLRGLIAAGLGPMILVIFYLILLHHGIAQTLSIREVCLGIVSLSALAFVAGGMNEIYQVEQLPLMVAILIHGGVLYLSYLATYLVNGWLERGITPILVFTGIFLLGYLAIWAIIYSVTKKRTAKINEMLKKKQESVEKGHP